MLYKPIIQVENKNVGLKVGGHKHTIAPPPIKKGVAHAPLPHPHHPSFLRQWLLIHNIVDEPIVKLQSKAQCFLFFFFPLYFLKKERKKKKIIIIIFLNHIKKKTIMNTRVMNILFNDALNKFYLRLYGVRKSSLSLRLPFSIAVLDL